MKILCSNLLIRIQKNIFAISSWKFESSTMLLESVSNKLDHPFPSCVWIVKHKHEAQQGLSRGGMKCLAAFDPAGFRILLTSFKVVLFSQRRTNNAEPRLSSSAHYLLLYRRVERRLKEGTARYFSPSLVNLARSWSYKIDIVYPTHGLREFSRRRADTSTMLLCISVDLRLTLCHFNPNEPRQNTVQFNQNKIKV